MKRLLLVIAILLISEQALASDQRLAHGAGTLPHLNLTLSMEAGRALPTPVLGGLRIDMGFGNRFQLGISESFWFFENGIEIHLLFNVFKTYNDSDFLSIYLNPGYYTGLEGFLSFRTASIIRLGIAYEHRFWKERRMGLYVKFGIDVVSVDLGIISDIRVGYQALLGKRFSIAIEPMFLKNPLSEQGELDPGGKVSLSWTFDLKRGATTSKAKEERESGKVFFRSVRIGDYTEVKRLIEQGADVNAKDYYGATALMAASEIGYAEVAKLLIEEGADVNAQSNHGYTALMNASKYGHTYIAKLLIEKGADVNAQTNYGGTSLIFASYYGFTDVAQLLKEEGAIE